MAYSHGSSKGSATSSIGVCGKAYGDRSSVKENSFWYSVKAKTSWRFILVL